MLIEGVEFFFFVRVLLDVFRVVIVIDIVFRYFYNVICLNDIKLWMCGDDSIMKLYVWGEWVEFI